MQAGRYCPAFLLVECGGLGAFGVVCLVGYGQWEFWGAEGVAQGGLYRLPPVR